MDQIRLAVVSDLHVGAGARSSDLCPPSRGSKQKDSQLRERFIKFLRDSKSKADYLLLPGDVTHEGQPDETLLASAFVEEIAGQLGVAHNRISFVPGNHDVDWRVLKIADTTGFRKSQRYAPLELQNCHFSKCTSHANGTVFLSPHYAIWNHSNALIVGYNSSHADGPDSTVHHGTLSHDDLKSLSGELQAVPRDKDKLRIFLVHHHPLQYKDPIPDEPDFSAMQNGDALLEILAESEFDILIHGHKHSPKFLTLSRNGMPPLVILCAGSLSAELDARWNGAVNNQFHLIDVEGRDAREHMIFGSAQSWSYNVIHGWQPSDSRHTGISHKESFGTYVLPTALKSSFSTAIPGILAVNGVVLWDHILQACPHFQYARSSVVIQVIDELAQVLNYRIHKNAPPNVVLTRA